MKSKHVVEFIREPNWIHEMTPQYVDDSGIPFEYDNPVDNLDIDDAVWEIANDVMDGFADRKTKFFLEDAWEAAIEAGIYNFVEHFAGLEGLIQKVAEAGLDLNDSELRTFRFLSRNAPFWVKAARDELHVQVAPEVVNKLLSE